MRPARLAIVMALLALPARAAEPGLVFPARLTAGPANHLLGTIAPGSGALYYVSDQLATMGIFAVPPGGGAAPLFDDHADATWPRLDASGKRVLYISFQRDAAGDLCLRDLVSPGEASEARCLTGPESAETQALWLPDGAIGVVSRRGLHGNFQLLRIDPAGPGSGASRVLIDRNLASPTISPDGRFIAYVPIERDSPKVGPSFASHAGRTIELRRLDPASLQPLGEPIPVTFDLPGATGFPAFAADGKHLYFSQYLNDTDFDGRVDGDDNGLLFRVPFDSTRAQPIDGTKAEQLTSGDWNCQYPAPAPASRGGDLVTTCLFEGALHVYRLPAAGAIPPGLDEARLRDELSATANRWQRLLILSHLVARAGDPVARASLLRQMVQQHLELEEYESADFYARRYGRSGAAPAIEATLLGELIAHRRAERALGRGQLSEQFVSEAQARLPRLDRAASGGTPPTASDGAPRLAALALLVRSEILDVLGDKAGALAALHAVAVPRIDDPFTLQLLGERALDLGHDLDLREEVLATLRQLASHPALDEDARVRWAASFVAELGHGRSRRARAAAIDAELAKVEPGSDLALLLAVDRQLLGIEPGITAATEEQVRETVFQHYRRHKRFPQRRAIIAAVIARAAGADSDYLAYQFAETWVSYVDQKRAARRTAESLYRDVVLERAYIERARGAIGDARGHFFGVTLQTDSLEAHTGFVEGRFAEGKSSADIEAEYAQRYAATPEASPLRFVRALLLARTLPAIGDPTRHAGAVAAAQEHLKIAARDRAPCAEIELLAAYLAHQQLLRTGDRAFAVAADTHYLLGLDLAGDRPRYRAALLSGEAALQGAVGNHRLALDAYAAREKLPFADAASEIALRLGKARSLLHTSQEQAAAAESDRAIERLERERGLASWRPLVTDRAALAHLAARDYARARDLYEALAPLIVNANAGAGANSGAADTPRNRLVLHLGRAAAATGARRWDEAMTELAAAQRGLDAPAPTRRPVERTPRPPAAEERETYRLVVAGLLAQAELGRGQADAAARALAERRDLLADRLARAGVDDDRLALALAEAQLGAAAHRRGDDRAAARHLETALGHADRFGELTNTPLHDLGLDLLHALATARTRWRLPAAALRLDLRARLRATCVELAKRRNPRWIEPERRLSTDLALLDLE